MLVPTASNTLPNVESCWRVRSISWRSTCCAAARACPWRTCRSATTASWALSVFCLAHLWLGGLGMYFLAHGWTKNRLAAATAGVIYSFNGMSLNALMWPAVSAAVGWMPWVGLGTARGWRRGGRWVAAASVLGAMQML